MKKIIYLSLLLVSFWACRKDEIIFLSDSETVSYTLANTRIKGFYLRNVGNMGLNRASLDYFVYTTGICNLGLYSGRNPQIVKELGVVGNDIKIYRS